MPGTISIDFDADMDAALERKLPRRFRGARKTALRVEHAVDEWLRTHPDVDYCYSGEEELAEANNPASAGNE